MTKKKQPTKPNNVCGDCLHYYACSSWNVGSLLNADADNCVNFERANEEIAELRKRAKGLELECICLKQERDDARKQFGEMYELWMQKVMDGSVL